MSSTLPCDVLCVGLANGGRKISRSLKLHCLNRNIGNLSAIQEKSALPKACTTVHAADLQDTREDQASEPGSDNGDVRSRHSD